MKLSFDDVQMTPKFNFQSSRKDVDPSSTFLGRKLRVPIISSNMDSVTHGSMSREMDAHGGVGCLHRFWDIDTNCSDYLASGVNPIVSIGLGDKELARAEALLKAGATHYCIDVAHGASITVVEQAKRLREMLGKDRFIIVGNFATAKTIEEFLHHSGPIVDAFKIGIGGGSACTTRLYTGCGWPTLESVMNCSQVGLPIIADGGIRHSGDMIKALAAGAHAVMIGRLLAATLGSAADVEIHATRNGKTKVFDNEIEGVLEEATGQWTDVRWWKKYRGSASQESYEAQGKTAEWRAPEGEAYLIPAAGSVEDFMRTMESRLRSAMTYNNAATLEELRNNVELVQVTSHGAYEATPHGKQ